MSEVPPVIYLARHGETAWSLTGQHTGRTDLPLTARGERNARRLGQRLAGLVFAKVFTSPLQRALVPANWQALEPLPRWMPIWLNGTMAITKACKRFRFTKNNPVGNYSATAAPAVNLRRTLGSEPIAL